jgi:muramoyltetrapeptide carboxypeptidase
MGLNKPVSVFRLKPQGTIGIYSPSEPVGMDEKNELNEGLTILQQHQFKVKLGQNCLAKSAYMAGSTSDRLQDVYDLVRDETVEALMASRGGKSCNQLVKLLDYGGILKNKKPIMGFSDCCVLLNAITARTGLVTFYGPRNLNKLNETRHSNLDLLVYETTEKKNLLGDDSSKVAEVIKPGKATGKLFGGNLNTFVLSLIYADLKHSLWDGGIFFWEDASMTPQLIDQHLTGLTNSGLLDRISGMVVGDFIHEDPAEWKRVDALSVLKSLSSKHNLPILHCPTFGHANLENPIIPIGAICTLNTDNASLHLTESIFEEG